MKPGVGRERERERRWVPSLAPPGKRIITNRIAGIPHMGTKIFIGQVKEIFGSDNCPIKSQVSDVAGDEWSIRDLTSWRAG